MMMRFTPAAWMMLRVSIPASVQKMRIQMIDDIQLACACCMIGMFPNNRRGDPVLRGKLEGVWKAIRGNQGFSLWLRAD
jgi:hypothetical protein